MVVEDKSLTEYASIMRGAREDIKTQASLYQKTTGEVREAYKMVILDKLWRTSRICGEFYYEVLNGISELEKEFLDVVPSVNQSKRYVLPQFEEDFERWKEAMIALEKTLPPPSDTLSVEIQSEPSSEHPPSSQ